MPDDRNGGGVTTPGASPIAASAAIGVAAAAASRHPPARAAKFRQAALVYLHVGLLYEAAVFAAHRAGLVPGTRGPVLAWLLAGAAIVALVFWGLWRWQSVWLARGVWVLHAARLPAVLGGAFFPAAGAALPPELYRFALVAVGVNLWMLARAGWDA